MSKFRVGDKVSVTLPKNHGYWEVYPPNMGPYEIDVVDDNGAEVFGIEGNTYWLYSCELELVVPAAPSEDALKLLAKLHEPDLTEEDDCCIQRALEILGWDIKPTGWELVKTETNEEE